ncbi:MAG: filamentous hemagglutinin N-terminal domain-containing protein, partial [Cyanobacteria bacterium P01_D01_bin.36]
MKKAKLTLLSVSIVLSSFFSVIAPGRAQANRAQAISDTSAEPIVIDSSVNADTQSQMRTRTSPSGRTIVNITGGARDGDNLFHNFERFNVPIDATVRFRPLANVENVLSRVTGSDPSDILGTLAVGGSANLWLINPNGIIFGEQAVIDIDGSFYATTASGIPVDAAGIFSLPTLQNPGLLTVSTESGFTNYLTAESGDISILGSRFNLPDTDDGTVVELSAANILTGELQIGSNRTLSLFAYGDIVTSDLRDSNANGTNIRIASSNGAVSTGRININASEGADAGNVNITAAGNIVTRGINTGATANVGNAGNGGDIILTTTAGGSIINQGNLNSRSRAPVEDSAGNAGNGNAGSGGDIILQVASGGNIINEGILRSQSEATNGNAGNSGNITLSIAGRGDIVNERVLRSQSGTHNGNAGTGGNIALRTTNGSITNEDNLSSVSAATNSGNSMNGGSINISATGNIRNQGAINSYAFSEAGQAQNGGSIDISAQSGNVLNNRTLRSTSTSNNGNSSNGGSIQIQTTADGSITNFGALNAQSLSNRSGNSGEGGDITLRTESGDIVNTSSGNIASASNAINSNRGSLNTRSVTRDGNAGNAGDITVLSTGGNIVLNAYLDAKSYSINGNSLSGGDI